MDDKAINWRGSTLRKRGKNRQRKGLHEDPVPNGSEGVSARFPCVCVCEVCEVCSAFGRMWAAGVSLSFGLALSLTLTLGCTL